MSKFPLIRLISIEMDPFFLVELIIVFSVFFANYSSIYLLGMQPTFSSPNIYHFTGDILDAIYFSYLLVLSFNSFMVISFLENGKILTLVALGRSVKSILAYMFLWAVLYPTIITALIFTVNVYFFEFSVFPAVFAEMAFYLVSFSVLFLGASLLFGSSIRNPVVSAGSFFALFFFILPQFLGNNAKNNPIFYALAGFSYVGSYHPFSNVFVEGAILELVMGILLFALSIKVVERRGIKPVRR
jgi:hypothetical protein